MTDETDLDASAPKRRRALKADDVSSVANPKGKNLQSHGQNSVVYVPVILKLGSPLFGVGCNELHTGSLRSSLPAMR
jgi:hypothetical protein